MPKFTVSIAREETTIYRIDVEANDESEAKNKAWHEFNTDTSILDDGDLVCANEYIEDVDNHDTEEIQNA